MDLKNYKLSLKLQNGEIELFNFEEDEDMYFVGFDLTIKINNNKFTYQFSNSHLEDLYHFSKKETLKFIHNQDSFISFSNSFIEIFITEEGSLGTTNESSFKIFLKENDEEEKGIIEDFFVELKALCEALYHY